MLKIRSLIFAKITHLLTYWEKNICLVLTMQEIERYLLLENHIRTDSQIHFTYKQSWDWYQNKQWEGENPEASLQINQICVKNAKWHMFCTVSVYRRNNLFRTDGYAQLEPLTNRYNMKSYQRNEKEIYNRLLYHIV